MWIDRWKRIVAKSLKTGLSLMCFVTYHQYIQLFAWLSGWLSSFENSWMVQNDFSVDIAIRPVQSHEQTVAITVNIRSLSRIVIENYYPKCYLNKIWKRHNKRPHATLHSIEPIQFERVSVIVIFCSAIRWVFLKTWTLLCSFSSVNKKGSKCIELFAPTMCSR